MSRLNYSKSQRYYFWFKQVLQVFSVLYSIYIFVNLVQHTKNCVQLENYLT